MINQNVTLSQEVFMCKSPKKKRILPIRHLLFKVNNRNIRKMCKICSKLIIKTTDQYDWRHSGIFIINLEQTNYTYCSGISNVDFEQVNPGLRSHRKGSMWLPSSNRIFASKNKIKKWHRKGWGTCNRVIPKMFGVISFCSGTPVKCQNCKMSIKTLDKSYQTFNFNKSY